MTEQSEQVTARLRALDSRIVACKQRRRAATMRASRAVNSDEGALTVC